MRRRLHIERSYGLGCGVFSSGVWRHANDGHFSYFRPTISSTRGNAATRADGRLVASAKHIMTGNHSAPTPKKQYDEMCASYSLQSE